MLGLSTLVQPHADAIIGALVEVLESPDGWARIEAAKLLLLCGWGPPHRKRLPPVQPPRPQTPAHANPAINPMSLERDAPASERDIDAKRATTPCPAAAAPVPAPMSGPNPSINPVSREGSPSALAAPTSAESSRGDADPMSRRVLPSGHSADAAFRRPLPRPPPVEPPGFHAPARGRRWPPWS